MKKSLFATIFVLLTIVLASIAPFGMHTASADTSPKLCGSLGWGVYPNGVSAIGFNASGENASGQFRLDSQVIEFTNLPYGRGTTAATMLQGQFTGVYGTDVASYWHKSVAPNSGLTFNFCIEPLNVEEPYTVQVLNTSGKRLWIYWQSRNMGELQTWERSFSGKSAHLELRTLDQDGRLNTVGGLTLYPTNWP